MHTSDIGGWRFERLQNGSVRVTSESIGDTHAVLDIAATDWAKIVTALSLSGSSKYVEAICSAVHG